MTTATWDAPAWSHVHAQPAGLPRLLAALQAAVAACDAAIPLGVSPAIDPYTGWAVTSDALGALSMSIDTPAPDPGAPALATPPTPAAAAAVVAALFLAAATEILNLDAELDALLHGPGGRDRPRSSALLLALAGTMDLLSTGYQETFGRPW